MGFSSITGDETIMFADNGSFDGTQRGGKMTANGELWIGSTASPHVRKGNITSTDGSITVTNNAGNINLSGFSSGSDLHVAKWIVNPNANAGGNQTTITAALAAAVSGETIFITPGTYTENILLKAGVNLTAFNCDAINTIDAGVPNVIINGTCTASFTGNCSLSGICLQTNSSNCLVVSGANATRVTLSQCMINATNNNAILLSSTGGSTIYLFQCNGSLGTTGIHYFDITGTSSSMFIFDGYYGNIGFSVSPCTLSGAGSSLSIRYVTFYNAFTSSSTSGLNISDSIFRPGGVGCVIGGSGPNYILSSHFEASLGATALTVGVGATITQSDYLTIDSTNTNAIDGTGTINYGNIVYTNTSSKNNVTTKTPFPVQAVTTAVSQLVYSSTNNDLAGLASANSASLVSTSAGVPVWSGTMTNGQMVIGSTGATPTTGTITSTGGTIAVSTGAGTLNLETVSGGIPWTNVTGTSATMAKSNSYQANNAGLVTLTMPSVASSTFGDTIKVGGFGAGGWTIQCVATQLIHYGNQVTSAAGTLASSNRYDQVEIVCSSTTTEWFVRNSQGNLSFT